MSKHQGFVVDPGAGDRVLGLATVVVDEVLVAERGAMVVVDDPELEPTEGVEVDGLPCAGAVVVEVVVDVVVVVDELPPTIWPIEVPLAEPPPTRVEIGRLAASSMRVSAITAVTNATTAPSTTRPQVRCPSASPIWDQREPWARCREGPGACRDVGAPRSPRESGPSFQTVRGPTDTLVTWACSRTHRWVRRNVYEYTAAPVVATTLASAAPRSVPATPKNDATTAADRVARALAATCTGLIWGRAGPGSTSRSLCGACRLAAMQQLSLPRTGDRQARRPARAPAGL
jgi:hypothetical protein